MTEEKLEQETGWGDASPEPSQEAEATEANDWGVTPSKPPLTLRLEKHSGTFDPNEVKIMVFGESGAYKTRFASTFPNCVFIDMDHGMNSVTEQVDKFVIHDDRRGYDEMKAALEYLQTEDHGFETVVLDTLNEMQRIIMQFTVEEYTNVRRSYGTLPGMSDYGYMLNQFVELWRDYRALPMRVVFVAQVDSQQFETDILGPQLIGKKTARELERKMDVIGYIYKTEQDDGNGHKVPALSFDATNYVTKDRSGALPSILENPTYARLAAFWK